METPRTHRRENRENSREGRILTQTGRQAEATIDEATHPGPESQETRPAGSAICGKSADDIRKQKHTEETQKKAGENDSMNEDKDKEAKEERESNKSRALKKVQMAGLEEAMQAQSIIRRTLLEAQEPPTK